MCTTTCTTTPSELKQQSLAWSMCRVLPSFTFSQTAVFSVSTKASTEDDAIWFNDHNLASCIRYLPDGADTTEASNRVTADESTRERIESLLSQCPEKLLPACCLCDVLTPNDRKDDTLFLSPSADAVVYHMQAK